MKTPKSLRIDGKRWTVRIAEVDEDHDGFTDWDKKTITVSPNPQEPFDEILLHEILHACIGKEVDLYIPDEKDELLVTLLAPRLLSVLKQMGVWR